MHPYFLPSPPLLSSPLKQCNTQHHATVYISNSAFSVKMLSVAVACVGIPWRTWSCRPSRTHRSPRTYWPSRTTRSSWRKGRTGRRIPVHMLVLISGRRSKRPFLSITTTGRERTSRTSWKRRYSGTSGSSRTRRTSWTTWRGWRQGDHPLVRWSCIHTHCLYSCIGLYIIFNPPFAAKDGKVFIVLNVFVEILEKAKVLATQTTSSRTLDPHLPLQQSLNSTKVGQDIP